MPLHKALLICLAAGLAPAVPAQRSRTPATNEIETYARLLSMADARELNLPLVDSALASRWNPLRAGATMAIGQVGPEVGRVGAPRLRTLLADKDSTVAADAAYALGLLRDSAGISALSSALGGQPRCRSRSCLGIG